MRSVVLLLALVMAAVACGDEAAPPDPSTAMGPGISVGQAAESDLGGPLLVNGYLFVEADGRMVLSEAIAESYPPQPAGATLRVVGLDPSAVDGLVTEGSVSWTEQPVSVLGSVEDGTLVVSEEASA